MFVSLLDESPKQSAETTSPRSAIANPSSPVWLTLRCAARSSDAPSRTPRWYEPDASLEVFCPFSAFRSAMRFSPGGQPEDHPAAAFSRHRAARASTDIHTQASPLRFFAFTDAMRCVLDGGRLIDCFSRVSAPPQRFRLVATFHLRLQLDPSSIVRAIRRSVNPNPACSRPDPFHQAPPLR